jgi:hypothetical protein
MLHHLDLESDVISFSILTSLRRRLFSGLSDTTPSFIVVDAVFAPSIFAPATACTQHLSILHPVSSSILVSRRVTRSCENFYFSESLDTSR